LRDLHPSDKDLSTSSCAGLSIDRIRGDGDATAWTQGLDLGTKKKYPKKINCEETRKCSRRRLEKEQEKQVQREASDGAKIVEGPVQAEAAVTAIEGMEASITSGTLSKREKEAWFDQTLIRKSPILMEIHMTYPIKRFSTGSVVSVIGLFLRCHIDNRLAFGGS